MQGKRLENISVSSRGWLYRIPISSSIENVGGLLASTAEQERQYPTSTGSCRKKRPVGYGPVFTKFFRIRLKIRLKLKKLLLWTFFETYYNYLTIDCWYLIIYILQIRLLGIRSFFYERKEVKGTKHTWHVETRLMSSTFSSDTIYIYIDSHHCKYMKPICT